MEVSAHTPCDKLSAHRRIGNYPNRNTACI